MIFDETRSASVKLQPTQLQAPYTIPGLSGGIYVAAAWQDINSDQIVNDNEPFGIYNNQGDLLIPLGNGQALQNVSIRLEAASPNASRDDLEMKADLHKLVKTVLDE